MADAVYTTIGEYMLAKLGMHAAGPVACPGCGSPFDPVAIVKIGKKWRCGHCKMAEDRAETVARELAADPAQMGWDSELGNGVKAERNRLLDQWAWTIRADSPLTADCQAGFLTFLKALNRITSRYAKPHDVVLPTPPEVIFELNDADGGEDDVA